MFNDFLITNDIIIYTIKKNVIIKFFGSSSSDLTLNKQSVYEYISLQYNIK